MPQDGKDSHGLDLEDDENFIQNKFGYCFYSIHEQHCVVYNLYVHPIYRKLGHSKKLLNYVINEIRETGYTGKIQIRADPQESSIGLNELIAYYTRMGFEIIQ